MPTLTENFKVLDATLKSNSPTFASESRALISHVRRILTQRWEITLRSTLMKSADVRQVWSELVALGGRYVPFEVIQIPLNGFVEMVAGQLRAGDYIQFGNHSKVYMVTANANSNASGQLSISIHPQLIRALNTDVPVIVHDVPFTLRQVRDVQEFTVSGNTRATTRLELDYVEVL